MHEALCAAGSDIYLTQVRFKKLSNGGQRRIDRNCSLQAIWPFTVKIGQSLHIRPSDQSRRTCTASGIAHCLSGPTSHPRERRSIMGDPLQLDQCPGFVSVCLAFQIVLRFAGDNGHIALKSRLVAHSGPRSAQSTWDSKEASKPFTTHSAE